MGYPVPKELKGEERLFVIPKINVPITKKSIMYNGPATLIAILIGKVSGNQIIFLSLFIVLNIIAYPFGNKRIAKNKFDNGGMDYDKYIRQRIKWQLHGGKIYVSYKGGE